VACAVAATRVRVAFFSNANRPTPCVGAVDMGSRAFATAVCFLGALGAAAPLMTRAPQACLQQRPLIAGLTPGLSTEHVARVPSDSTRMHVLDE
jgi:hypothetical protein